MKPTDLLLLIPLVILIGLCAYGVGFQQGFATGCQGEPAPKPKQRKRRAEGGRHLTLVRPKQQQRS